MSRFYLLHNLVKSSLFNSTLLIYWDNILVDLAQDLHNTTEILSHIDVLTENIRIFSD